MKRLLVLLGLVSLTAGLMSRTTVPKRRRYV